MARELPNELARHLGRALKRTRRRYRKRLACCQEHFSENAVHDLRVETRRALALLDLMLALDLLGSPKKPRRALKKRFDAFDELRDAQVELTLIAPWLKRFPEAAEFKKFLECHEGELISELKCEIRALGSKRVERMIKALEDEVATARGKSCASVEVILQKAMEDAFHRVLALRERIRRRDTETIHCTRIAFKSFRYLCELVQPLVPELTKRRLRQMHEWQTRMGDIQDAEVLLSQIERAVKRGKVRLVSVKRLHAALAKHLVVLINKFVSTADDLERFRPKSIPPSRKSTAP